MFQFPKALKVRLGSHQYLEVNYTSVLEVSNRIYKKSRDLHHGF